MPAAASPPPSTSAGTASADISGEVFMKGISETCDKFREHMTEDMRQLSHHVARTFQDNTRLKKENQDMLAEVQRLKIKLGEDPGDAIPVADPAECDVADGKNFRFHRSFNDAGASLHSVDVSQDCKYIGTASWNGKLCLYETQNLNKSPTILGATSRSRDSHAGAAAQPGFYRVAFAKKDPLVGCACVDKKVYIWNYSLLKREETRNEAEEPSVILGGKDKSHTDEVNGLDFHATENVCVTTGDDSLAIIWDYETETVLRQLKDHGKEVYGATFLNADEYKYNVATISNPDFTARIFDMRTKEVVHKYNDHTQDIIGIDFASQTHQLATSGDDGLICIYDYRMHKLLHRLEHAHKGTTTEIKRVRFSRDGRALAAGTCDSTSPDTAWGGVAVYIALSTSSPQRLHIPDSFHSNCVFDVAWGLHPTSGAVFLVSASHDKEAKLWHLPTSICHLPGMTWNFDST
eukprot:TRINITY_DN62480_c0_g1_i1.p1 TRINITY_DN62480_c0_g1~~TRINITY_DN62480_c0_g1_i1.p1  ORF type:complete len:463 (+),score=85.25 TRINITY_DN62480_c0_g1_i1:41-1429(+)